MLTLLTNIDERTMSARRPNTSCNMASKARLKSGNFRVQIREKDFDLISKTFKTEQEADS